MYILNGGFTKDETFQINIISEFMHKNTARLHDEILNYNQQQQLRITFQDIEVS